MNRCSVLGISSGDGRIADDLSYMVKEKAREHWLLSSLFFIIIIALQYIRQGYLPSRELRCRRFA